MSDTDYAVQMVYEIHPLRKDILRSAVRALQLPTGSRGLLCRGPFLRLC